MERYFAVPAGWRPPAESTVRVAAALRNGAPLVVERSFGKGRVLAFLTTAAPTWNNWARNPSYVVAIQDMEAYLAQRPGAEQSRLVGAPLELTTLDSAAYQPQVRFTAPEAGVSGSAAVTAAPRASGSLTASFAETDRAGFYEVQLVRADGASETRRYALNVDPAEGDLTTVNAQQLAASLEGVQYKYEQAAAFQTNVGEAAGFNLTESVLDGLVLLLLAEQVLAWSASCHPPKRRALAQGGAA